MTAILECMSQNSRHIDLIPKILLFESHHCAEQIISSAYLPDDSYSKCSNMDDRGTAHYID
jgi:hypothetical protein